MHLKRLYIRVFARGLARRYRISPMRLKHIVSIALITLLCTALDGEVYAQQVFLNNLPFATGISTDRAGNVYVESAPFNTYVSKYSSYAQLLGRAQVGQSFSSGDLGYIERVPGSDNMLLLTGRGVIYIFGPTLRLSTFLDLRSLSYQVAYNTYDATTGRFVPFGMGSLNFGDIAAYWASNNILYLYVTATTNSIPVILRLELNLQTSQASWRGIAKTTGGSVATVNLPPGIAVSSAGWVLTSLPFRGYFDSLVAFKTSFPASATNLSTVPRFILLTNRTTSGVWDMASVGMTTDAAGNFYVSTGVIGTSFCGTGGSSTLVLINKNPTTPYPRCFNLPSVLSRSRDVTVSPVGNIAYMTADGKVIRYGRLAAANFPLSVSTPIPERPAEIQKLLALSNRKLLQAQGR